MRETAKQLREGSQKTSAEERQLARTLDQVSERLGAAAGGAEAQRLSDELKQTQAIRDRLNRLEQQIREAEGRKDGGTEGRKDGRAEGRKDGGTEGRKGGGTDAPNAGGQELEKLRAEYQRELARAREALGRLQRQGGGEGSTPEQHEYSRSAPGTEQFKQDRSKWESLRKDVDVALERYEAAASDRLKKKNDASDRLNAGASDRVPDKYRDLVATYFQSLATGRRK
jgi:hypothetical protein